MARALRNAASEELAATDRGRLDAMPDDDIARQIAANPDAAPDIARQIAANPDAAPDMAAEIDVRAIWRAVGMTPAQFAPAYECGLPTAQEWERSARKPSDPARTRLCPIG
jgi:putative transcriptional regulator